MTDLVAAIRAELDDFCSDQCAKMGKTALLGLLDLHGSYDTDPCLKLDDGAWWNPELFGPCPTIRTIATGLGIETADD